MPATVVSIREARMPNPFKRLERTAGMISEVDKFVSEKLRLLVKWDDHTRAGAAAKKMQAALTELKAQVPDLKRRLDILGIMPEDEFQKHLNTDPKRIG